nr:MAG TPA_asm: hypothetical protein [Caudoviricetes sp.]
MRGAHRAGCPIDHMTLPFTLQAGHSTDSVAVTPDLLSLESRKRILMKSEN